MCTVVLITGHEKIFLKLPRDENLLWPSAIHPEIYDCGTSPYLASKEALEGGTWIGVNNSGNVIILLNGGFKLHERKSTGLIAAELLHAAIPVAEWPQPDMTDIEPFTLLVLDGRSLYQVWHGEAFQNKKLKAMVPHSCSSSTLYNKAARINRKLYFQHWMCKNPTVNELSFLIFFTSITGCTNELIINRNEKMKTFSYTYIEYKKHEDTTIKYFDFIANSSHSESIKVSSVLAAC